MMNKRISPRAGLVITLMSLAALSLPACAGAGGEPSSRASTPSVIAMTRAPQKANGAGVGVSYKLNGTPTAGEASTLVLSFDGVAQADATVRFSTDAGLTLLGGDEARSLPAGQVTTLTLQVVPSGDGIAYVNVFTTQNRVTTATSIPVQVGKAVPTLRAIGELKPTTDGDRIISIPVK